MSKMGEKFLEDSLCYFCGHTKEVGGAWVSFRNPAYFPHRGTKDKPLVFKIKHEEPEGHALCMLLEARGFIIKDNKLVRKKGEE
jgi:hypothetical protein